jgi:hypothetical protein
MKNKNSYYYKRDDFYFISFTDKKINRDNKISSLFDENALKLYIGHSVTSDISRARFWKDLPSTKWFIKRKMKELVPLDIYGKNTIFHCDKTQTEYSVNKINRDEFIKIIPDSYESPDFVTNRNLKMKSKEISDQKNWNLLRSKYKAISSYVKVQDPNNWLPCKNCGLIPLIWEFDNGRSTACGCGKNEYDHHSIKAESITSYMKRNGGSMLGYNGNELKLNWNNWVMYNQPGL